MKACFLFAVALLTPASAWAEDVLRLKLGDSTTIALIENPSTGYSWKLDANSSRGLERIAVEDEAYQAPSGVRRPGEPGVHRWTIRARAAGAASLQFTLMRPWEKQPIEVRRVNVVVTP